MSGRKLSSIKQLSLNYDETPPATEQRRKTFRKQFSEDIPDNKGAWLEKDLGIRISLSAKLHKKDRDKPPPVKLAWAEEEQKDLFKKEKQEDHKLSLKYPEVRRVPEKITKQTSLEKDSVLYSRQELAERLRQAWKERDQRKQNLNIFLAHNAFDNSESNNLTDKESSLINENKEVYEPKIVLPEKPKDCDDHFKTIFQKKLRKTNHSSFLETSCLPPKIKDNYLKPENKASTVVVVPITENDTAQTTIINNKVASSPRQKLLNSSSKENLHLLDNPKPIDNIVIRPSTAAQRRDSFKKRSNSAFQGSITTNSLFRPPLLRASSVPSKQEQAKPKFLTSKRRTKSGKRKNAKNESKNKNEGEEEDEKNKKTNGGTDIVTMVSLTSPAGSDTEELPQIEPNQSKTKHEAPANNKDEETKPSDRDRSFVTLRKAAKSVSFQQSSIHAVRSFSASFPARRGSFASALFLGNSGGVNKPPPMKDGQKMQEKRSTTSGSHDGDDDYDERVAKRRLVRAKSVPLQNSIEDENHILTARKLQTPKSITDEHVSADNDNHQTVTETEKQTAASDEKPVEIKGENRDTEETAEMKFDTPKEKQCWDLYCKMSEKGVSVSFDTILRGMLTPTEYRMRRKSLIPLEDC